ncbi:MAG: hypothetical protein ACREPE_02975 [Lysobacter sp.]
MNKLIALFYFVLSLYGCDVGGTTFVHRTHVDGTDTLYSSVAAQPGAARFVCLRSASGQCYYTLFPRDCMATSAPTDNRIGRCRSAPIKRFAIAEGNSRKIADAQRFRPCVSAEAGSPGPDCGMPEPIVSR